MKEEYLSGTAFVNATPAPTTVPAYRISNASIGSSKHEEGKVTSSYFPTSNIPPKSNQGMIKSTYQRLRQVPTKKKDSSAPNYFHTPAAPTQRATKNHSAPNPDDEEDLIIENVVNPSQPPAPFVSPRSLRTGALHTALTIPKKIGPRHDPKAPDAVVLPRPKMPSGTKAVDVVIDPIISRYLRPHQKEGVKFLYECIMGMKEFEGQGAILADEMGLGKTLTVIALIWTLLSHISMM